MDHDASKHGMPAGTDAALSVTLQRLDAVTGTDREELRALSRAVYPPSEAVDWPGRHLEWASPEWCVCVRTADGALASFVGIVLQRATYAGQPVRIGGIGGVMTHPALRRRGLVGVGMRRAVEFFQAQGDVAFGLLVCATRLLGYYGSLGWREFAGTLHILQHGQPAVFDFNHVMTIGVQAPGPVAGSIDLLGPPW